ncbi:UDP-N-acetylmuramoyl-tripeptide--D-alanyl-D-alanine ligase [Aestuariivivens sediminis]|uniref:UDP-N-acetylmuramoyl-tripeptide--D-alanyl-D- alanine ligase n=1 Tax=Aestuariivivens sediminis TaxID=2913557 RepID=UPI001F5A49D6|nr:UDP-N-acetylmuramoyl-tripeptide--D-alanyl-D-alanine ligase [Aestuariivivens sediminis]
MKIAQLHSLFLQSRSACTDTRKIVERDMFFALKGEHFNGNEYAKKAFELGAKYAIIDDPQYALNEKTIIVKDVLETLQELASFHRQYLKTPIIALTGSNGKTTTKELINAVLSKKYTTTATSGNLNNHIGVPLTLLSMAMDTDIGIVEMGANHQGEIAFLCSICQPDFGYITNFGKAHLEGFGGVEGVIKGKSELYEYLIANGKTIFVNANDPIQIDKTKNGSIVTFGSSNQKVNIEFTSANPFVKLRYNALEISSQMIGGYNFTNIAAAIAIGHYFKVEDQKIKLAIEQYVPNNNRSQIIKKGSSRIILDAYNANPTSMREALLNLEKQSGKKIAILGDMLELGDYAEMEHQMIADLATSLHLDRIILIGENFSKTILSNQNITSYLSFEEFLNQFHPSSIGQSTLLIKGSRGMALERVLNLFQN